MERYEFDGIFTGESVVALAFSRMERVRDLLSFADFSCKFF